MLKESFSGCRCPCRGGLGGLSPSQGPGSVDRGSIPGWWALYLTPGTVAQKINILRLENWNPYFRIFFNRTRNPETNFTFGFLNENTYLQGIRTDSWGPQLISYQDLGTRLAPSPTNVLLRRQHSWPWRQNHSTRDIPARVGQIFTGPGSVKFAVPNFKIKTVRNDPYGRKSNRKNKEIKQKWNGELYLPDQGFRFATQIFNGPPLVKYRIYIKYKHNSQFDYYFSFFIFSIKPPAVRDQFTVLILKSSRRWEEFGRKERTGAREGDTRRRCLCCMLPWLQPI